MDSIGDQREIGPEIQEVLETGDRYNNQRYKIIFKFQIRKVLVVLRFSTSVKRNEAVSTLKVYVLKWLIKENKQSCLFNNR